MIKFVQLVACDNRLYALDDRGEPWCFFPKAGKWIRIAGGINYPSEDSTDDCSINSRPND